MTSVASGLSQRLARRLAPRGIIFDLDGVLCFTDCFHYEAWLDCAREVEAPFDWTINDRLRGVSRMESLEIILEGSPHDYSDAEKERLATEKNERYRALLAQMTPEDMDPAARAMLRGLREAGFKLAVGSSSKNAPYILERLQATDLFDAVIDGSQIERSKPDPEVFLRAADALGLEPGECLVVEDAVAGLEAARAGGMACVGVGRGAWPLHCAPDARVEDVSELVSLLERPGSPAAPEAEIPGGRTWWKEAVVYQIYPRSFYDANGDGIGDLRGIIAKLDYLSALGVDVVWLNPIYRSPGVDNGYDISDYRSILDTFGTMDDFDELLAALHARGMRLVMDLVVNHTSDQHPWFIAGKQNPAGEFRDFYIWRDPAPDGGAPNNWGSCFGGSAWTFDEASGQYYLHLFTPEQPDLNWENPRVRDEVFDMMDFWFKKGIDGFRMDVISLISKAGFEDGPVRADGLWGDYEPQCANGPRVHEYLHEMHERVLTHYDDMTVGENAAVTPEFACLYAGFDREELDMAFQFELMDVDGGESRKWTRDWDWSLADIKRVMTRWQETLEGRAWNALFWGNHDQPRVVSRFGDTSTDARRKLSAKMLATCLYLMQGTPYIFQGDEIAMTNCVFTGIDEIDDVHTRNAFAELTEAGLVEPDEMMEIINYRSREHARTPMPWSVETNGGFTEGTPWHALNPNYDKINVEESLADADSVFHYYRRLIAVRRAHEVLVYGRYRLIASTDEHVYAYERLLGGTRALIACNFGGEAVAFDLPEDWTGARTILANYGNRGDGELRPFEALVLICEDERKE